MDNGEWRATYSLYQLIFSPGYVESQLGSTLTGNALPLLEADGSPASSLPLLLELLVVLTALCNAKTLGS